MACQQLFSALTNAAYGVLHVQRHRVQLFLQLLNVRGLSSDYLFRGTDAVELRVRCPVGVRLFCLWRIGIHGNSMPEYRRIVNRQAIKKARFLGRAFLPEVILSWWLYFMAFLRVVFQCLNLQYIRPEYRLSIKKKSPPLCKRAGPLGYLYLVRLRTPWTIASCTVIPLLCILPLIVESGIPAASARAAIDAPGL